MPIVVKKYRSNELKYPYAYDEFGNYLNIASAVNISSRRWYLYPNKQVELILAALDGKVQQPHWRTLQNQKVFINGREYEYNHSQDSESYEHKLIKGKIIEESCVYYKENKVLLFNAREEVRILDTRFRCDILATLEDGTPCAVEVIKSSDLSKNKLQKINELQLLTFKIYIDDKGNQISSRDSIVGNRDIAEINARIQNGEGKIAELREQFRVYRNFEQRRRQQRFRELVSVKQEYRLQQYYEGLNWLNILKEIENVSIDNKYKLSNSEFISDYMLFLITHKNTILGNQSYKIKRPYMDRIIKIHAHEQRK